MAQPGQRKQKGVPIPIPTGQYNLITTSQYSSTNEPYAHKSERGYVMGADAPDYMLKPINPRCFTCGKVILQPIIEEKLLEGMNISDAGKSIGLVRQCCQRMIQSSVPLVQLRKEIEKRNELNQKMIQLVGYEPPPSMYFHSSASDFSGIRIIDNVPSGIDIEKSFADIQIGISEIGSIPNIGDQMKNMDVVSHFLSEGEGQEEYD